LRSAVSTASVTLNVAAYYSGTWNYQTCSPFSATTSYQTLSCDVDMTGLGGDQFRISFGGDTTNNAYVAWIGLRTYDSDPYGNYGTGIVQTCNASTVPLYGEANCDFSISSAQILALPTLIPILTGGGSGKMPLIDWGQSTLYYHYGTAAYDNATFGLVSVYGASGFLANGALALDSTATTNQVTSGISAASTTTSVAPSDAIANVSFTGGATHSGDGTITGHLRYTVVPVP